MFYRNEDELCISELSAISQADIATIQTHINFRKVWFAHLADGSPQGASPCPCSRVSSDGIVVIIATAMLLNQLSFFGMS